VERRRRIWCEHLPPEVLDDPSLVALLERHALEPLVALPPAAETPAMQRALGRLGRAGVPLGLWPLLDDAAGYWPSTANAHAFAARVEEALAFAAGAGATVRVVAIDLEPPLSRTRALLAPGFGPRVAALWGELRAALHEEERRRAAEARACFEALARGLQARGMETIAAVAPPALLDLEAGVDLWQSVLKTPVWDRRGERTTPWAVVSPMLYTSMMRPLLTGLGPRGAPTLLLLAARLLRARLAQARPALSLGCVGPGKLGDEPTFADPEELARDVALASAAGIDDLALFDLAGALRRGPPEPWLRAFTDPGDPRGTRPSRRAGALMTVLGTLTRYLGQRPAAPRT
jgi:hypothetical protein